jgi:hypothetical protein
MFMEQETQMALIDKLLFQQPKNAKLRRNLMMTIAALGMGKSALYVDEYCRRKVLHSTQGDACSDT